MWDLYKKVECGDNVEELIETEECKIVRLSDKTGDGLMTIYSVFPGVYIMYNDFHMEKCFSNFKSKTNLFCIDHCREGRMEHDIGNGTYCYLTCGDLRIDDRNKHAGQTYFPIKHYHGISIIIDINIANNEIINCIGGFNVNISDLKRKYCKEKLPYIVQSNKEIEHIFAELYTVPTKIRKNYHKIKILELLLFLYALELPENKDEKPYFYKSQVEKIKAIHALLIADLSVSFTIDELSLKYDIATTPLKECFKSVYGEPIFTYLRTYKMNYAANLLKTRKDLKIIDIAGLVGYNSPSKFAVAFKNIMGKSPLEYRKSFV